MSVVQATISTRIREKLVSLNRRSKVALMLLVDGACLPLCFMVSMLLRLGDFSRLLDFGIAPYLITGVITPIIFATAGLYRAVIRFIDQHLLRSTGIALGLAVILAYGISSLFKEVTLPRGALVTFWFVAFAYVVISRITMRNFLRNNVAGSELPQHIVAIYGAGVAGVQLAHAIRISDKYHAVCFFDDKRALDNQNVAGLKVFHSSRLRDIALHFDINLIVLAVPSTTPQRRREIVHLVREAGLEVKTLNVLMELVDNEISAQSIREIEIDDLLGRPPVPPRIDLFAKCILGKKVLVTGGGGSIGSELCRQLMSANPQALHLLDHSEYALYAIETELRSRFPSASIYAHLGSVSDKSLVERIIQGGQIDTLYHAAAYKHVPLVEANMAEGIRNNVLGTQIVASAAEEYGVQTCVLISTDKAVRPTNIMGASKRVAELIFQAAAQQPGSHTTFCMVRFGNVLGSSGSVVPLFQKQIAAGGPITVTHPEVVRYFMLIPEAAQLVIQAGAMAKGGEVFVLDMGEPVKIVDLARTMIEMTGLQEKTPTYPDGDIEIRYVGLRPGEKLYEELLIGSQATGSEHPRILCSTEYFIAPQVLKQLIERLVCACASNDGDAIKLVMQRIVPEYTTQASCDSSVDSSAVPPVAWQPIGEAMRKIGPANDEPFGVKTRP